MPTLEVNPETKEIKYFTVGSVEFCKVMEEISKSLIYIAKLFSTQLGGSLKSGALIGKANVDLAKISTNTLWGPLVKIIMQTVETALNYADGFLSTVQKIPELIMIATRNVLPCAVHVVVGVEIVRAAVKALQRARIGTDALLWATVDITFQLPIVEKVLDYVSQYACNVEIPGPGEAIRSFIDGFASKEQMECWLKMNGCSPEVWEPVITAGRQKPTNEQLIIWAKRQQMTPEQIKQELEIRGFTQPEDRDIMEKISWYVPTISDMLHFIQRNVYDTSYIRDFRLLEDFEEKVWKEFQPELYQIGMSKKYAEWWYAGHWMNPSPTQLYEMVQRLRPDRVKDSLVFTRDDAMRVMVEQDIAPYFRPRFLEIAYKTFGLRFLRQMYDTFSIDDEELWKRFQDIGYKPEDAEILVDSERQTRAWRRATRTKGWSPTTIAWALQKGHIDEKTAEDLCKNLYLTPSEIADLILVAKLRGKTTADEKCKHKATSQYVTETEKLFEIGAIDDSTMKQTLMSSGYDNNCADIRIASLRLKVKRTNYQQLIMAIKKALLKGVYTIEQAINRMIGAGISKERALDYISYWLPDFTPERKKASADKAIKWYEEGLIDEPTVISRLHNLGFDDIDTLLYVAQAKREILEREVKRQQTIEKGIASKQKELERLAKQAEAQLIRIRNELRKLYPVSRLQTWLKKGLISVDNMAAKLRGQGYPQEAIDNYVKEVLSNGQQ